MKLIFALITCLPLSALAAGGTFISNGVSGDPTCSTGIVGVTLENGAAGDFGNGTVTLEYRNGNGEWYPVKSGGFDKTWTAPATENADMAGPRQYRLVLTGATTPQIVWELNCSSSR